MRTLAIAMLWTFSSIANAQTELAPRVPIDDALEQHFKSEWTQSWFDDCQASATKKELRGDERRAFYVTCLGRTHLAPVTVWVDCLNAAAHLGGLDRGKSVSHCVSSRGGEPFDRR